MKKYKLKPDATGYFGCAHGKVYNEDYQYPNTNLTVGRLAKEYPNDWELVEDFVLPEKWCVKITRSNRNIIHEWRLRHRSIGQKMEGYVFQDAIASHDNFRDSTEITFEQFKDHILKQNDMKQEIIGYSIKEEFIGNKDLGKAIATIEGYQYLGESITEKNQSFLAVTHSRSVGKLKKAGALNLWFDPVYKAKYELPKINGYDGKLIANNETVVYGNNCAHLSISKLRKIHDCKLLSTNRELRSITLSSGVEITLKEIKQIIECVDNQ